jgi:hypothetical protein
MSDTVPIFNTVHPLASYLNLLFHVHGTVTADIIPAREWLSSLHMTSLTIKHYACLFMYQE